MCKKFVLMSLVLLLVGLAGSASAFSEDFESYTDTNDLNGTWFLQANWGGSPSVTLDTTGGAGGSQAMSFSGNSSGGGLVKNDLGNVSHDWSAATVFRFWQKGIASGATDINDFVYRLSVRADGRYYDTELYTATSGGGAGSSAAFRVSGVWGGGAAGGYIDIPLAGYGTGTGADDWFWKQTTGTTQALDWTKIERLQFVNYSYASGGSYSTLYDNMVPEPATIGLLGLGGLALIRRKRR